MRKTPAREAMVELLRSSPEPIALRELHERIRTKLPTVAYSTVFRLAKRLEDEGAITRVDWRERGSRFEWADRPHHHHIVCTDCGKSTDVDDRDLGFDERRILSRTGFRVDHHSIELEGTCPDCQ